MQKLEAIKKAYGGHYNQCKPDENGWSEVDEFLGGYEFLDDSIDYYEFESSNKWRPITLRSIENNNNWIKINSEIDLPKQENGLWLRYFDGSIILGKWCIHTKQFKTTYDYKFDTEGEFTHYMPISKPPQPIY